MHYVLNFLADLILDLESRSLAVIDSGANQQLIHNLLLVVYNYRIVACHFFELWLEV